MTAPFVPPARPKASRAFVEALIHDAGFTDKLALVGRRGYFDDIARDGVANRTGVYDDAIFLLTPTEFAGWNANTDPSRGEEVGQAVLQCGRFLYAPGPHPLAPPNYPAFRQAQAVTILRVGATDPETGFFGINIHRGGEFTSTGSEGCQTIYKPQWEEAHAAVLEAMRVAGVRTIPYILTAYRGAK